MLQPYFKSLSGKNLLHLQLPALLNHYGVTVDAFTNLRFAKQPDLVHHLFQVLLKDDSLHVEPSKKGAVRKLLHRCYKDAKRWASVPENVSIAMTNLMERESNFQRMSQRNALTAFAQMMSEYQGLYMQEGLVKARLGGKFSYDTYKFYTQQLKDYFELHCGNCDNNETLLKPMDWLDSAEGKTMNVAREDLPEVLEEACNASETFTHVIGPYIRCSCCEQVSRAELDKADSLPENARFDDNNEWEDHEDNLEYLVEQLIEHGSAHGLPKPLRLNVAAHRIRWDGSDGYKECAVDGKALAQALTVNSDFSVNGGKLWLEPDGSGWLSCSLAHHDATGSIQVEPIWMCELADRDTDEDALVSREEFPLAVTAWPQVARILLCGADQCFEFSSASTFKIVGKHSLIGHVEWLQRELSWRDEDIENTDPHTGAYAAQIAGNLLMRQLVHDIRMADSQEEGDHIITTCRQIRQVIDTYNVELEQMQSE